MWFDLSGLSTVVSTSQIWASHIIKPSKNINVLQAHNYLCTTRAVSKIISEPVQKY